MRNARFADRRFLFPHTDAVVPRGDRPNATIDVPLNSIRMPMNRPITHAADPGQLDRITTPSSSSRTPLTSSHIQARIDES